MKLKAGVELVGLRREMRDGLARIDQVHKDMAGTEATLTSTTGDQHRVKRSAHYRGDAVDVRTWHVDGAEFADKLAEVLGEDFVVLFEVDHIHIHWGPVYAGDDSQSA